jgi:hypothetical protein
MGVQLFKDSGVTPQDDHSPKRMADHITVTKYDLNVSVRVRDTSHDDKNGIMSMLTRSRCCKGVSQGQMRKRMLDGIR